MAYGQISLIQAPAGFFVYFVMLAENGFLPSYLFGMWKSGPAPIQHFDSEARNNSGDNLGQEWTYRDRRILE